MIPKESMLLVLKKALELNVRSPDESEENVENIDKGSSNHRAEDPSVDLGNHDSDEYWC
jgi:hypothetical protein